MLNPVKNCSPRTGRALLPILAMGLFVAVRAFAGGGAIPLDATASSQAGAAIEEVGLLENNRPPCVEAVLNLTQRTVHRMHSITGRTIADIHAAADAGDAEAAKVAADAGLEVLETLLAERLDALDTLCDECIVGLIERDAPLQVIQSFIQICQANAEIMLDARRSSAGATKQALDRAIADICIDHLHQIAVNTAAQNKAIADACIDRIVALLEAGQVAEAHAAARQCIAQVRENTAAGVDALHVACARCVRHLLRGCDDDRMLVMAVRDACRRGVSRAVNSAQRAIEAIRATLPTPDPNDPAADPNDGE